MIDKKHLWDKYHAMTKKIAELEVRRAGILAQIEAESAAKIPTLRDAKICMAALNDRKQTDIAGEFGLNKGTVSRIIKHHMPFIQQQMVNGTGGTVDRPDSYTQNWDEIDDELR